MKAFFVHGVLPIFFNFCQIRAQAAVPDLDGKLFPRHNLVAERAETAGKGVTEFKISVLRNVKYLRNWIFTLDKVPLLPDVVSPESVVPDPVQCPPEAAVERHPAV